MRSYTVDAVALLAYLVDSLPQAADRAFAAAEAGEARLQTPGTTFAEVLYAVSREKDVRGTTLEGTPEETHQALLASGPVSVSPVDEATLAEYGRIVDRFNIHDGLVVASHRARGTDAIVTSDAAIDDARDETVWR